jgi:hypothetical protein
MFNWLPGKQALFTLNIFYDKRKVSIMLNKTGSDVAPRRIPICLCWSADIEHTVKALFSNNQ